MSGMGQLAEYFIGKISWSVKCGETGEWDFPNGSSGRFSSYTCTVPARETPVQEHLDSSEKAESSCHVSFCCRSPAASPVLTYWYRNTFLGQLKMFYVYNRFWSKSRPNQGSWLRIPINLGYVDLNMGHASATCLFDFRLLKYGNPLSVGLGTFG